MFSAGLALLSSILWGASDFTSGVIVRRMNVVTFAVLSQGVGLVAVAVAAGVIGDSAEIMGAVTAAGGGMLMGISLYSFLKAMQLGVISVVSPLLASGSIVTFVLAVAAGERPSKLAIGGALIAVTGAVLASREERARGGVRKSAIWFAVTAATAVGVALYLLGRASGETGSAVTVVAARAGSVIVLGLMAARLRVSYRVKWRDFPPIAGVGVGSALAVFLYSESTTKGLISVSAVLASLYPIVTVLLAYVFLGERLSRAQLLGVALALCGVVLVTLGQP
jgi:drug/metabolite transporter (DMT)-like permease